MFGSAAAAQTAETSSFDLSLLDEWTVPAELFFVRDHFPVPSVSSAGWTLAVGGAVAEPLHLTFEELSALPRRSLPVTLECAENPVGGGLVSHAVWAGASLAGVMQRARPKPEGRFARLSGADGFSYTIPLERAAHPDALIAQTMNGEKLPVPHGFPLRAVIPGWYGMASVKWLRQVDVVAAVEPNTYMRLTRSLLAGVRPAGPVTLMNVNSAFARPVEGAILTQRRFVIRGVAWAGEARIRRVEISTDGKTWQAARIVSAPQPYAWVHWTLDWRIPGAGSFELTVRAEDDRGRRQPAERDPARADAFELNTPQTVRVTVL